MKSTRSKRIVAKYQGTLFLRQAGLEDPNLSFLYLLGEAQGGRCTALVAHGRRGGSWWPVNMPTVRVLRTGLDLDMRC